MAIKSLLSQARQIKSSEDYQDLNYVDGTKGDREIAGNMHTSAVAEGTNYLEDDINYLRIQINEIIGGTNWYDKTAISLKDLASTGNKTIVQPVQLSGGVTFSDGSGDTGLVAGVAADESGITLGFLFGAAATDGKHRVTLRDAKTNMPIVDADENMVFGLVESALEDEDDITLATDLKIKTYTDVEGTITAYEYSGDAEVVIPQRVDFADSAEDFAMINAGFANSVGSLELGDRIWVALDTTSGIYTVEAEEGANSDLGILKDDTLTKVINALIAKLGKAAKESDASSDLLGLEYGTDGEATTDLATLWTADGTTSNYLDGSTGSDDSIINALGTLDAEIKKVEDLANSAGATKYVAILTADIDSGTAYTIPDSGTVLVDDKDAIDVCVNGQRLSSDFQVSGVAGEGDYGLASSTTISFNFDLLTGDVIAIDVFKKAAAVVV